MAWVKRLEQNWPLVVALMTFVLAITYHISRLTTPEYPDYYNGRVVYPLLMISNSYLGVSVISLISFAGVILAVKSLKRRLGGGIGAIILLFLANGIACSTCVGVFVRNLTHRQTISFGDHVYHLAAGFDVADFDYSETFFTLYECDSIGILCQLRYISPDYSGGLLSHDELVETARLNADPDANMIYLQVGTSVIYARDVITGNPPNPVRLPELSSITVNSAHELTQLAYLIRGSISQVAWSPDSETLAVGGRFPRLAQSDRVGVWLFDIDALEQAPRLLPIRYRGEFGISADSVAFSLDGTLLAAGSGDYTVVKLHN